MELVVPWLAPTLVTRFHCQLTSTLPVCSIAERPLYQRSLVLGQLRGQGIERKPSGASYLDAASVRFARRATTKGYLNLLRLAEGSDEGDFNVLHFKSDLFAQLASQAFIGLLVRVEETAGYAPAAAGAKHMFE